jgi:NADH-quinone oxidoreductase subunit L
MLWAMSPLAVLAIVAGLFEHQFVEFVTAVLPQYEFSVEIHEIVGQLIIVTTGIALTGIGFAVFSNLYREGLFSNAFKNNFIYKILDNQYYIPKIYDEVFSKPYKELSELFWHKIDNKIVDATVDGIAKAIYTTGEETRGMQSGNLSYMLRWMVAGISLFLISAVAYTYSDVLITLLQGVAK